MRLIYLILLCGMLNGCLFGPNFKLPPRPATTGYAPGEMPKRTVSSEGSFGHAQIFHYGDDLPAKWWSVFHSKPLTRLIEHAMRANPDLKAAAATLRAAQEATLAQHAAFFPWAVLSDSPMRKLTAGTYASDLMSNGYLYSLNVSKLNLSYAPDVFGLTRRQVESYRAMEESAAFGCEAARLTLSSRLVLAVIQEGALNAELKIVNRCTELAEKLLIRMQKKNTLGAIAPDQVAAQAILLAQTQATLPPLQQAIKQNEHMIASLSGRWPNARRRVHFTLQMLSLPTDLPVSLPARLVEQRPDVRAAQALLHAASAQVGVASINRLPNITLNANGGYAPVSFNKKSIPASIPLLPLGAPLFWNIGGSIAGTVFDAGALLHNQRAAMAAYVGTKAQYQRVVLDAVQQVADTLSVISLDAQALNFAVAERNAAAQVWHINKQKWLLGELSSLEVLIAEQSYQQARLHVVQQQANRFTDTVSLFQALGGGTH